jgi:hypothetical protein
MNYALDALWWKLTAPSVRDLASLLTAPPLWQSGGELSVRELLGEQGFRYLLALDADPAPLTEHLTQRAPFGHRLGIYAEELLAFWFAHAPHTKLHARNLPVFSDGQTLGAADFVVSLNRQVYHIELACKYYGGGSQVQDLRGLNPKDTLAGKAAKLVQQLNLLHTPQGRETLTTQALPDSPVSVSVVRGIGFFPHGFDVFEPPLNPYCWRGVYIRNWAEYRFERTEARYHLLDRMAYLAPARVAETDTLNETEIRRIDNGLIAVLELRPDGFWHEAERIMKAV